jgi:hypothetical protein
VENLEQTKKDLLALAESDSEPPPSSLFVGGNGKKNQEDFKRCCLGQHFITDPDGVMIDMAE